MVAARARARRTTAILVVYAPREQEEIQMRNFRRLRAPPVLSDFSVADDGKCSDKEKATERAQIVQTKNNRSLAKKINAKS